MKALSSASISAAVIVALAIGPAFANTTATSDKGMERATPAQSKNANVTTGQNFQDEHDNATDPNSTRDKKVAKKKSKKAKHVAQSDAAKNAAPQ